MSRKTKFSQPVVQKHCVSIGGGLLRSPVVVKLAGPRDEYIELKKMNPWLCEAASGQCYSRAPLSRTQLIEHFKAGLKAVPDGEDPAHQAPQKVDKMDGLFGNKPKPAIAAVVKPRRSKTNKTKFVECATTLKHPSRYGGADMYTWRLWQKGGSDAPWIHIDDLCAAIDYLHEEVVAQGVPALDQDESHDREREIGSCSWDRRDFAWMARVTGASGDSYRKCFMVPTKNSDGVALTPEQFGPAKETARLLALSWVKTKEAM
jgi:hypothetical protein